MKSRGVKIRNLSGKVVKKCKICDFLWEKMKANPTFFCTWIRVGTLENFHGDH